MPEREEEEERYHVVGRMNDEERRAEQCSAGKFG